MTAAGAGGWEEWCRACGQAYPVPATVWRCECGGLLDLRGPVAADPVAAGAPWSMWRYAPTLPPLAAAPAVTMGEGLTPLVAAGDGCWWKLDFVNPTLSFKDRGAAVVMAAAAGTGVRRVVADSSGNAGTAVAAYAARAGMAAEVWVPGGTSAKKIAAMEAHGATVRVAAGDREAAAEAARARADEPGWFYASHVYQPLFVAGVKTVAFELWEQLGRRAPEVVVVPAGNGTLVLGATAGFAELAAAGRITAVPRVVAVQAAACAPLAGLDPTGPTVAEGIAIARSPRQAEIVAALDRCGGRVVTVEDRAILEARADLARRGVWVEPTAAAAWAAYRQRLGGSRSPATVVVLCGAGLKAPG
ncbi:MAG: pyridoxal-phosphate dependent enzyme [Actinomycetota bacterium]|nr:pyridoxal-phosphate dependent enzyme [Actinomycetota bacterium]